MLNNFKRQYILPSEGDFLHNQLSNCIDKLTEINKNNFLIQLTFFIYSKTHIEYIERKRMIYDVLKKEFNKKIPAVSIIAQYPDNKEISMEIIYISKANKNIKVEYTFNFGINYSVVYSNGDKEIFAGGISDDKLLSESHLDQANSAFRIMESILQHESMTFANVIRQWNYIENIVGIASIDDKELQNYQILNDVRTHYYSKSEFINGYPAATAIGMNTGGIILEFYSSTSKDIIKPVKNFDQQNAYEYSQSVLAGNSLYAKTQKSSPKFERAKYINLHNHKKIFISGTASIKNEHTIGINNIIKQTEVTIDNIHKLISTKNLEANKIKNNYNSIEYSFMRVYVKNPEEMKLVKKICDASFPGIQINYLIADICRENLLIEIEGEANLI